MDSGSADVADDLSVEGGSAGAEAPAAVRSSGYGAFLAVAAFVLVADQLSKWWAVERLDGGRTIDLFWTARFKLVRNDGAAFSLGTGITPVIAVAAIALSIAMLVAAHRIEVRSVRLAMGLVLGGAVGNVIDRIFRSDDGFLSGAVIDFIDFQWYPVFNIADVGVVVGGLLIVLLMSGSDRSTDHEPAGPSVVGETTSDP